MSAGQFHSRPPPTTALHYRCYNLQVGRFLRCNWIPSSTTISQSVDDDDGFHQTNMNPDKVLPNSGYCIHLDCVSPLLADQTDQLGSRRKTTKCFYTLFLSELAHPLLVAPDLYKTEFSMGTIVGPLWWIYLILESFYLPIPTHSSFGPLSGKPSLPQNTHKLSSNAVNGIETFPPGKWFKLFWGPPWLHWWSCKQTGVGVLEVEALPGGGRRGLQLELEQLLVRAWIQISS